MQRRLLVGWLVLVACAESASSGGEGGASGPQTPAGGTGSSSAMTGGAGMGASGSGGTGTAGSGGTGAAGSGGTGASGSAGASAATGGSGSAGMSAATGGSGSAGMSAATGGSGAACEPQCGLFTCCNGACVNPGNDIHNCGGCGKRCEGAHPFCDAGVCRDTPPCEAGTTCAGAGFCCGTSCCEAGQLCCDIPGPIFIATSCVTPTAEGGTCPMGCLGCDCNAPDTPIATPAGDRPISSLRAGDLVYSIEGAAIIPVPIALAVENPVHGHRVVRLRLRGGVALQISASHPLADGRAIGDLLPGDRFEGASVEAAELVDYTFPSTFDILPDSSTGVYFAGGLPLRSTLH